MCIIATISSGQFRFNLCLSSPGPQHSEFTFINTSASSSFLNIIQLYYYVKRLKKQYSRIRP